MDTHLMLMIGIGVLVLVLTAVAVWVSVRATKSHRLKAKFGPEYDQTVERLRDRELAERELQERERRVARFHIVPLSLQDSSQYRERWTAVQGRFVDAPKSAVEEAHQLVHEVMKKRGYPVTDFEQVAADLSVQYPGVVIHYRAANRIADNSRRGIAKTEDLRQALIDYRALFEELLEESNQTYLQTNRGRFRSKTVLRGGLRT
jgi:hypothetical protein